MSDVLYELGAETWVRFGSNGIGFLNHKNNFNSQVSMRDEGALLSCRAVAACVTRDSLQSCMGNWQEARTVAILDKDAPGHLGFQGSSTVTASAP